MALDHAPYRDTMSGATLHWAGRVTDEVFSFLGPATAALAQIGLEQTVILFDEPLYRHLLPRFDSSVSLIVTPVLRNPYAQWRQAHAVFVGALREIVPSAVHLHGVVPFLLGADSVRTICSSARLYHSPHGSRSLGAPSGALLRLARKVLAGREDEQYIANMPTDARVLGATFGEQVNLVASAVAEAFFDVERSEVSEPKIVTCNRIPNFEGAQMFAQLAVLLCEASWHLRFEWIGGSDSRSQSCLEATGVVVSDLTDDTERARRLATSWIFVAPAGKAGFPLFLAEAMVLGLPCVAIDTVYHRDLIEHGVTGYLCHDEQELVAMIARLVDSPALRASLGNAASLDARWRFSSDRFRGRLRESYGLSLS